ncbi:MAG: FtsQ-type POTRA domain-containing protein [Abditibacteriaceae bacterium]
MMRQHYNNTTSHDRHDDKGFNNPSLQLSEATPPSPARRLRAPLWKRLRAFCLLLIFLGVVELGTASLTASHFNVQGVRLEGLASTPVAPVQEIAQKLVGQNWFRANSSLVVQNIKKIPTVDTVRVRHVIAWPPQLEVVVQERQPFAMIGGGSQWWLVDTKGVPYQMVNQSQATNLDAITCPAFHPQLGKPLPQGQWQKITTLFDNMQADQLQAQQGFRWNLRQVSFDRNGNVSLQLKDAPHQELLVQLGNDQWSAKLHQARLALTYLDKTGQRAKVLNFISYKIPTWTPQSTNTTKESEQSVQGSA